MIHLDLNRYIRFIAITEHGYTLEMHPTKTPAIAEWLQRNANQVNSLRNTGKRLTLIDEGGNVTAKVSP